MKNEFKSIKAFAHTWRKVSYVTEALRFMGYRLSKSECLDLGINLIIKGFKAHLDKKKQEQDGVSQ